MPDDETPWPDNPDDPNNVELRDWLERRIDDRQGR